MTRRFWTEGEQRKAVARRHKRKLTEWREAHPERVKAWNKRYYRKNRERILAALHLRRERERTREHPACARCGEPVLPGDDPAPILGATMHYACGLRMIIGGVNHIMGNCTCCGGTEPPDPPFLSKRQAALAAVAAWRLREEIKTGPGAGL